MFFWKNVKWIYTNDLAKYLLWVKKSCDDRILAANQSAYPSYPHKDVDERLATIERSINYEVEQKFGDLKKSYEERVEGYVNARVEQKFDDLKKSYEEGLEGYVNVRVEQKFDDLKKSYEEGLEDYVNARVEQKFGDLKTSYEEKLKQLEEKCVIYENQISELQRFYKAVNEHQDTPKPKINPINLFLVHETKEPCFSSDANQVAEKIQTVIDTSKLNQAIVDNSLPDSEFYLKIIQNYNKQVGKLKDIDIFDFDEEEISEIITSKFFKICKDNLLSNLVVSLHRSLKFEIKTNATSENVLKLGNIVAALNEYLQNCGIYNRNVAINHSVSEEDINDMQPNFISTAVSEQNNIISDVECLPYFINYINDDSELSKYCYRGSMVVLKYDK